MQFNQPDTLVPDPYNPLDWNRYGYARYNPVKYTDPTGHAVSVGDDGGSAISKCDLCYDDEYYYGYWRRSTRGNIPIPKPKQLRSSTYLGRSSTSLRAGNTESSRLDITPLGKFLDNLHYYKNGSDVVEIVEIIGNVGVPVWRQTKGTLPGGPLVEGIIGAGTQLSKDVTDSSRYRSWQEIRARAAAAGVEDALTDLIASPAGAALGAAGGAAGAACGPAAPVCVPVGAAAGYLTGANATTWFMDEIIWEPINSHFGFYR